MCVCVSERVTLIDSVREGVGRKKDNERDRERRNLKEDTLNTLIMIEILRYNDELCVRNTCSFRHHRREN